MTYQETKTKRYITRLPLLIDAAILARQDWYILEKEVLFPPERKGRGRLFFALVTLVFPILRITYARLRGTPGIVLPHPPYDPPDR